MIVWKPRSYIQQPFFRFCWACQISQIILYKQGRFIPYRSIPSGILWKLGFSSPIQLNKMCKKFWLKSKICSRWTIESIKDNVRAWRITILLIAHAYDEYGIWFNFFKACFFQHYISIWWFDDNGFYVYDSSVKKNDTCLCVGNIYIKNELLQRCWDRWGCWWYNNIFISIN